MTESPEIADFISFMATWESDNHGTVINVKGGLYGA